MTGAFDRALADVMGAYREHLIRQLEEPAIFRWLDRVEEPMLGPPRPCWWEIEMDRILGVDAPAGMRSALFDLIERVEDGARDW